MKPVTTTLHAALVCALLCLAAAGCDSGHGEEGCTELCEHAAECPGATAGEDQCLSSCQAAIALGENAGCARNWETLIECRSHAGDACNEASFTEECSVQFDAYASCIAPYCQEHPSEAECAR